MQAAEINFTGALVDLISTNAEMDDYENLLRTIFSHAGILTYQISLYDYRGKDREWVVVKLDKLAPIHTYFLHYDKDIAARVSIPSTCQEKFKKQEKLVKAIIEHCYLKAIKHQKIDNQLMRKDLALAARMQGLLIPKNLHNSDQFKSAGLYRPNYQVGGDFYDVYPINENEIGFCIGDISGKGVNAAIIMANFQALAKTILVSEKTLEPVIERINEKMFHLTDGEKFITLFLGVYNTKARRLVYANCGHLPIPLFNGEEFQWLEKGSTIIGAFEKLPSIEVGKVYIKDSMKLFLYTDGALNLNFDHEPLLSFNELKYVLQNECANKSPKEIVAFFDEGINSIDVEEDLKDDISILAIELS
jgi:sigma-B regulation protein RsbU (phosphoserine phosphatase)